jgi:hypothetical protein
VREPGGKDLAASIHARLLNLARERGEEHQRVLDRYALERFLYRLSITPEGKDFVLKGALLFLLWAEALPRPTRDADLLGFGDPDPERLAELFQRVCGQPVDDDGLVFEADSVKAVPIREGRAYRGVRLRFRAFLGNARVHLQVDVGFGDAVVPEPEVAQYPTLLPFPAPRLRVYPQTTVVAEKLQTMVELGMANSRMRDYFDIHFLSAGHSFDGGQLVAAIAATFDRRRTEIPAEIPEGLSDAMARDEAKSAQWRAFLRKGGLGVEELELGEVMRRLRDFLLPPMHAAAAGRPFERSWPPGGDWR